MPSPVLWPTNLEHELAKKITKNDSQKQPSMMAQQEEIDNISKDLTNIDIDLLVKSEGPDIDWVPSFENYMARVDKLSNDQHSRTTTLPPGFPKKIKAHRAWVGHEFSEEKSYIYVLSEPEVNEIEEALDYFKGLHPPRRHNLRDVLSN